MERLPFTGSIHLIVIEHLLWVRLTWEHPPHHGLSEVCSLDCVLWCPSNQRLSSKLWPGQDPFLFDCCDLSPAQSPKDLPMEEFRQLEATPCPPRDTQSPGKMSSITFAELVNVAIPQCGVVNFRALHLLLQSILDHIQITELKKVLSGDEDFLHTLQAVPMPREGDTQPIINPMKQIYNVFDHVVDRIERIEGQLVSIQDLPTTSQLLEGSKGTSRPALELWNLIRLQKKVEGNEEAATKSMKALQDLLTDLHALKVTTETLEKDVDMLKCMFEKVHPEKMDLFGEDLKMQNRKLSAVQQEVASLQNKIHAVPKPEEMVLWSGLHEAMFTPGAGVSDLELSSHPLPGLPFASFEDVGQAPVSQPIQGTTPLQTVLRFEAPAVLSQEKSAPAIVYSRSQGLGHPQASTSEPPQPPQDPFPRAPSPATASGSLWPSPLQPHQLSNTGVQQLPPVGISEGGVPQDRAGRDEDLQDGSPQDGISMAGAPKDRKHKGPKGGEQKDEAPETRIKASRPALKKLKATAALAAATTAAATKVVQDVPTTEMATAAAAVAASGPMGVFSGRLGAGSSHGATSVALSDDEDLEDFQRDYDIFAPEFPVQSTPSTTLSRAVVAAMQASSPEDKKTAVKCSMSHIAQMPARHDSLKEEFARLSKTLSQCLAYLANMGSSCSLATTMNVLEEKMENLQKPRLQTLQSDIERLDLNKADKRVMERELSEKADRSALASKANRADLETVGTELNEMVQNVLSKVTTHEDDCKESLEHLRKDLDTKLVHSDLDSLKRDVADVGETVRKFLMEGLRVHPDRAAGFKKKLFERVKCISCDRTVDMMTGPQLITICGAHVRSQMQPASVSSYEYPQQELMREQRLQLQFQDLVQHEGLGSQRDWGNGPQTDGSLKQKQCDLSTLCPYGDPKLMNYDTVEVDILGVDGILYKGRMNSQFGTRTLATGEKERTGPRTLHRTPALHISLRSKPREEE